MEQFAELNKIQMQKIPFQDMLADLRLQKDALKEANDQEMATIQDLTRELEEDMARLKQENRALLAQVTRLRQAEDLRSQMSALAEENRGLETANAAKARRIAAMEREMVGLKKVALAVENQQNVVVAAPAVKVMCDKATWTTVKS